MNHVIYREETSYSIVIVDFSAKVRTRKIPVYENLVERGEIFVNFLERQNMQVMNTFCQKRRSRKTALKSPSKETNNEVDFIIAGNERVVKDAK